MPSTMGLEGSDWMEFEGKIALVTGVGHGLGLETARQLRAMGASVYGADVHADEVAEVVAELGAGRVRQMDVTDPAAWADWSAEVLAREGRIDILVNNAGGVVGQVHHPVEEVADGAWDAVLRVNLTAAFYGIRAVAPPMKRQRGGAIVNISSGAGRSVSLTGIQAYTSAKAGQIGLTRQMAYELGPYGIRVNCVAPGFVRSNPTTEKQWEGMGEQGQRELVASVPMRRLGYAQDIADGVLFLLSDRAAYITGQVLSIDGGMQLF